MDLSAYNLLDTFTLHDVAYLLCGHEPIAPYAIIPQDDSYGIIRHKADTVGKQLLNDVHEGKLIAIKNDTDDWRLSGLPQWVATRQALRDWATAKNVKPAFLFPECIAPKLWGLQRKHTTEYLEIMEEAIQEFWEKHDPNRPPKKNEVVSWLEKRSVSTSLAESMDTIMRTLEARKGGQKPRTPKTSKQATL